jgi:hypothetical protein
MTSWFASLTNYVWELNTDGDRATEEVRTRAIRAAIPFAVLAVAFLLLGAIKTALSGSDQDEVEVAAIILTPEEGDPVSIEQVWADNVLQGSQSLKRSV